MKENQNQTEIYKLLLIITTIFVGLLFVIGAYFIVSAANKNLFIFQKSSLPQSPTPPGQSPQQNATFDAISPNFDNVNFTVSADGKNWQPGNLIAKSASVPDIIQLKKDSGNFKKDDLLIYFANFSNFGQPKLEALGLIVSHDNGKTWSNRTAINLDKGAAVDPSIVQLDDGRLRLYFFGPETIAGDPALAPGPHKVYSAISSDGINFTAETGVRFQDNNLTDPEVIRYGNQWFMYYSVGSATKLAVGSDGLNFSAHMITGGNIGGVPGAVVFDGGVRLFACGKGLTTTTASDGINFTKEQADIFGGKIRGLVCDPAVIKMANGGYSMVYKTKGN